MIHNHRGSSYFFSEWSSLFLLPTKLVHLSLTWKIAEPYVTSFSEITMENDWWLLILRNHSQWKIVKWSIRSWKSYIPVWKNGLLRFFKVSQCKLKQKETILKLGNTLKSKSKFTKSKIGWGAPTCTPYQGFTLNPLGAFWLSAEFSPRL